MDIGVSMAEFNSRKKELVAGFFIEGYVHHNYDFLLENISEHYYDHSPAAARSNQGCVDILKIVANSYSNMNVDIFDMIEEGDRVAVRVRFTATHSGEILGIAPTGKKISFEALEIFRIENDRIVESWGYWPDLHIKGLLTGT